LAFGISEFSEFWLGKTAGCDQGASGARRARLGKRTSVQTASSQASSTNSHKAERGPQRGDIILLCDAILFLSMKRFVGYRSHVIIFFLLFIIQFDLAFCIRYNRWQYVSSLSPKVAPILGESALVDAETGQVYWQDTSRFRNTVEHAYWSDRTGVSRHLKSTFLSLILWVAVIRFLVDLLQKTMSTDMYPLDAQLMIKKWSISNFIPQSWNRGLFIGNKLDVACSFVIRCVLKVPQLIPKINKHVISLVIILYLLEAYSCSTKIYLENTLTSPGEVTEYMENLRQQKPSVVWNVRCFHYENRRWLNTLFLITLLSNVRNWLAMRKPNHNDSILFNVDKSANGFVNPNQQPLFFQRIIESHCSSQMFYFSR
jgi:hypothetical protein